MEIKELDVEKVILPMEAHIHNAKLNRDIVLRCVYLFLVPEVDMTNIPDEVVAIMKDASATAARISSDSLFGRKNIPLRNHLRDQFVRAGQIFTEKFGGGIGFPINITVDQDEIMSVSFPENDLDE